MSRIAACIEYCGANYFGWQRQKHAVSVQETLEKAISRVANEQITVIVAGRTDTGVHGIGQIVHFDTSSQRSNFEWLRGVNTYLPDDISLIWTHIVSDGFHARFSALSRSYRYVILNRSISPSYLSSRVTWHRSPLDATLMQSAAQYLLGTHDFRALRAAGCQSKDPVKTVTSISINQSGPWIWLDITANGFLQHMIRNIIGVLGRIGEGTEPVSWMKQVLESRDRTQGGITAPPDGLYFVSVEYDSEFQLPEPPDVCRFW